LVDAKEMINPTNYFMLMDGAREDFVAKFQDYLLRKRKILIHWKVSEPLIKHWETQR